MRFWKLSAALFVFTSQYIFAQSVGIGNTTPNPNSLLEIGVSPGEQGLLMPRLKSATITTLGGAYTAAEEGMTVYDIDNDNILVWTGTVWKVIGAGAGGGIFAKTGNIISNEPTNGGNYITDDFVVGSPSLDYDNDLNHSDRLFFSKPKAAFRVGADQWGNWNDAKIGLYSTAMGYNTLASSESGVAIGEGTVSSSYKCIALGMYNMGLGVDADGTHPSSSFAFGGVPTDPILEIGIGNTSTRKNAITVLKNGNTGFNNQNAPMTSVHINGAVTYEPFDLELINANSVLKPDNRATYYRLHPGGDLELTIEPGITPGQYLILENVRTALILIKDVPGVHDLGPRHPDLNPLPAGGIILDRFDTATFIFDGQQWVLISSSANSVN